MKYFVTVFIILLNTLHVGLSGPIEWIKCSNDFNFDQFSSIREIVLTPQNYFIAKIKTNTMFSSDNGQSWADFEDSTGLIKNLSNYYSLSNNQLFAKFGNYIYRSNDNGTNWTLFLMMERNINQFVITSELIILLYKNYSMIAVYDLNSRQLISTFELPDTRYLLTSDNNVYVVTTYNAFVLKNDYKSLILLSQFRQKGFKILAIDTLFIFNPQTTSDLRISYDYGTTWSELYINNLDLKDRINGNMALDSRKTLYVFIRGEGLFKSSDIGKTWNKSFDIDTSCKMKYISPKDEILLLTERTGLFRSNDGGKSWINVPLPKQAVIPSDVIDFVSNSNSEIYLVKDNKTYYYSSNRGDYWEYNGFYDIPYQIAISDSGDVYHLYANGSLSIRYAETKSSWMISNNGMNYYPKCLNINNQENLLLLGTSYGGIYRSTNNGLLWKRTTPDTSIFTVDHIQYEPGGDYYAISQELGLLRSTNKGVKWVNSTNSEFYKDTINDFKINSNSIFYALKANGELFTSSDRGFIWEKLELPMSHLKVNSFIFTKTNDIFVGTDYYGVLRYEHNSRNWSSESSGLNTMLTNFIRADSSGFLYCSVPNEGLYRSKQPVEGPSSVANSFNSSTYAIEIHPNPAGEYIEISGLSKGLQPLVQGEEIRIYNVLGERVMSVETGQRAVSTRIDVSHMPPGLYFVRYGEWTGKFVKVGD